MQRLLALCRCAADSLPFSIAYLFCSRKRRPIPQIDPLLMKCLRMSSRRSYVLGSKLESLDRNQIIVLSFTISCGWMTTLVALSIASRRLSFYKSILQKAGTAWFPINTEHIVAIGFKSKFWSKLSLACTSCPSIHSVLLDALNSILWSYVYVLNDAKPTITS